MTLVKQSSNKTKPKYAKLYKRALSYGLDLIPVMTLQYVLENMSSVRSGLVFLITILFSISYSTYFHGSKYQATPGKMLMQIKVVNKYGARIGYWMAFERWFVSILGVGFFFVGGFLVSLFATRPLHDLILNTYVVDAPKKEQVQKFSFITFNEQGLIQ